MHPMKVLASWARDIGNRDRLLLAGKTAFAAALAWFLAPLVPWADDKYTYYAPLGVVISMYPTLVRSLRSGLQAMAGLALGIALGIGALQIDELRVVGVAAVIGIGVLLAGLRVLGTGRNWVPITALFVLLIGASRPEDYSRSYLVDMAFGIIVGMVVNLVIFPPVYLRRASKRLSGLAQSVGHQLEDVARAVAYEETDREDLSTAMDELDATSADVRVEVQEANESRKGNPWGHQSGDKDENEENYRRLRALQRCTFFTRDLLDVLSEVDLEEDGHRLSDQERKDLCLAIMRTADLVRVPKKTEDARNRLHWAEASIETLMQSLDEDEKTGSSLAPDLTASLSLRRIVNATRPFV